VRVGEAIISAEARVGVSSVQARQWFLDLKEHPERYRFETHAGFRFTEGDFGADGARFETRERFYGVGLTLRFEMQEVGQTSFRFVLTRPPLPLWGAYFIEDTPGGAAEVRLEVGGTRRWGELLLRCPLVGRAVRRQIRGEVEHVKASMEASCAAVPGEMDGA
jgi:hypothetical protein